MSVGTRHLVLYDYDATNEDELTIREGQIVYVTEQLDKGWVRGTLGDAMGMFPEGYVQLDETIAGTTTQPSDTSTHNAPTLPNRSVSSLTAGLTPSPTTGRTAPAIENNNVHSAQPTVVAPSASRKRRKSSTNPKRMSTKIAVAPILPPHAESETDDSSGSETEMGTPATVVFDYTAADKGQLSLVRGETIEVLDKLGGGWWKGKTEDGEVGFFPGSYVREKTGIAPSAPSTSSPPPTRDSIASPTPLAPTLGLSGTTNLKRASTVSRPSLKRAIVVYSYTAKSSSELTLTIGDEVLVYPVKEGESSGWWTGALVSAPNTVAHFPGSYVKLIDSKEDPATGSPSVGAVPSKEAPIAAKGSTDLKDKAKADNRKSQPPSRPSAAKTDVSSKNDSPKSDASNKSDNKSENPSNNASTKTDTKSNSPAPSKPPPFRPAEENGSKAYKSDNKSDTSNKSDASNKLEANGEINSESAEKIEKAAKTAEQSKQGLIKLQQQTKGAVEGMLQRLDNQDKERQRLENAMREMGKTIKESKAARSKVETQNKVLYQQITELQTKLNQEAKARAALEARLDLVVSALQNSQGK